mgnify:FL=1
MAVFLGWQDRIKNAVLSGGSWVSGLGLANLTSWPKSNPARSTNTSASSTQFDFDLGAVLPSRAGMLVGHNLSLNGVWRLTLSASASGNTDRWDSGYQPAWFLDFDNSALEWESESWWEGSTDVDLVGTPYHLPILLPDWIPARYGRLELIDPDNPAGFVQAGRFVLCNGMQALPSFGVEDSWRDLSTRKTLPSGISYIESRDALRAVKLPLDWIDRHAEFGQLYEMQRRLRTVGDVLYLPSLTDYQACQRTGFIGALSELSPISHPLVNYSRTPLALEELK